MNTPPESARTAEAPPPRRRRWLLRALGVLLLLLMAAVAWLLGTQSGLDFALLRARAFTHGALSVQQAQGRLWGSLHLRGVRWRGAHGLEIRIATARIDYAPLALLRKRLDITRLDASGLRVSLPAPQPPSNAPPNLHAPLAIHIVEATLRDALILRQQQRVFAVNTLSLRDAAWTHSQLALGALDLNAPQLALQLQGQLGLDGGWPGTLVARLRVPRQPQALALTLHARSDGRSATLDAHVAAPFAATLHAQLATRAPYAWQGTLRVPRFALAMLLPGNARTLALNLAGHGDATQALLAGTLDVDAWPLRLRALEVQRTGDTLQLRQLALASPRMPGSLDAQGHIALAAHPVSADLALRWHGVQLPAALLGQALASAGSAQFQGSAQAYRVQSDFSLDVSGKQRAQVTLAMHGDTHTLAVDRLRLQQTRGRIDVKGDVALAAPHAWRIAARATRFDPALLAPAWPGELSFALGSSGQLDARGPTGTLVLHDLNGTLRGRALRGSANLGVHGRRLPQGTLDLAAGASTLRYAGSGGAATARIDVRSLADFLPQASGSLHGSISARGVWPTLDLDARLSAGDLRAATLRLGNATLRAQVRNLATPHGTAQLSARTLQLGAHKLDRFDARVTGNQHALTLHVDAGGAAGQLALDASASASGKTARDWQGELRSLQMTPARQAAWTLQAPVAWRYRAGALSLADACLAQGAARLCVGGSRAADGSGTLDYRLAALPLASLAALVTLPEGARVQGTLDGAGALRFDAALHLRGHAQLQSPGGSVSLPGVDAQPLGWRDLRVQADIGAQSGQFSAHATLLPAGTLDASATLSGAQQTLGGRIVLSLPQLHVLEPFVPQLARVQGALAADFALAGTLRAPVLTGQARVTGFAAELPLLGLHFKQGDMTVARAADGALNFGGSVQSGAGTLAIAGSGNMQDFALTLKGQNILAADLPAARVQISPDLHFTRNATGYVLDGSVLIPSAQVDLAKLPGAGAAQASPDVVIVNAPPLTPISPLPLRASVLVKLGTAVKLRGFGLDGKLSGQLHVDEQPGRAPSGRGEIGVSGTYRAYGQDLTLKQSRLLFAGTPLDNPGLDLTAERVLPDVTPGLRITGTAQRPVLQVFSTPTMEQSEALSYLITGKPLSALKSGQGDMLNSAAQALGSAGGDLLAKEIGARIGVDASVGDNAALGGAALTVGKYLSPRLYVGYGVGLFTPGQIVTLRYKLSRLFDFEAQTSALYNRFSLKYRVEK
ncbi:translocation/assembly module TamB domain-containing protein [Metallibacterium scheffleri]|nr:translocation/assembly module TamB domain-containing protein [Metallibacterium scheffleri]